MSIGGNDSGLSTAENYRMFAREAHGRSPGYESLARSVATDEVVLGFLLSLPKRKRQPNLLFAAARYILGEPPSIGQLRALLSRDPAGLAWVMLTRRTQTNEPARCATILPALAQLPEPLALIEVGASAGLTLLFDRYSYDYAGARLTGSDPDAPVLRCALLGLVHAPVPDRIPAIAWRAGLDLNPLDVTMDDDVRWLSCLVWPGEGDRQQRLDAAITAARRDPPLVRRGDLLSDLPALAASAPPDATLVIYHSAVLAYVAARDRTRFAATVRELGAVWLSNEAPGVVTDFPARPEHNGAFVLARDGQTPLAFTDGHGTWLQWLDAQC
ncbi:MAG: DUF2332 domain-containing protein [Streptosporangiaceae bacterium]